MIQILLNIDRSYHAYAEAGTSRRAEVYIVPINIYMHLNVLISMEHNGREMLKNSDHRSEAARGDIIKSESGLYQQRHANNMNSHSSHNTNKISSVNQNISFNRTQARQAFPLHSVVVYRLNIVPIQIKDKRSVISREAILPHSRGSVILRTRFPANQFNIKLNTIQAIVMKNIQSSIIKRIHYPPTLRFKRQVQPLGGSVPAFLHSA